MSILEMDFTRAVTITPCTGEDRYGKKTYGTPVTVPAIITSLDKNIKDFRGNTFLVSGWVAVPPDTAVSIKDQVTLPDGLASYIGSISKIFDEEARDYLYTEIYVGKVAPGEGSV